MTRRQKRLSEIGKGLWLAYMLVIFTSAIFGKMIRSNDPETLIAAGVFSIAVIATHVVVYRQTKEYLHWYMLPDIEPPKKREALPPLVQAVSWYGVTYHNTTEVEYLLRLQEGGAK